MPASPLASSDSSLANPSPRPPESRAADEVRAHPARDALGALAFDVLSRQAEGRALFAGREFIEKRAIDHGALRDDAQTGAGNVLDMLERGPEHELERAIVTAFAMHGLGVRWNEAAGEERAALLARFVRHADWLELATPYVVFPLVDLVLSAECAASVWHEVAQAIVDDATGAQSARGQARARNAGRLSALAASESDAARRALDAVIETRAIDAPCRAMALALRGDAGISSLASARIQGRVAVRPRSYALRMLRWVTGWALASWVVRGIGSLFGFRREIELALSESGLDVREARFVLGRKIAESTATVAPESIVEVGRAARYPALRLSVGVIALSVGLLFGGLVLFDGARSGELSLMLAGAALALTGAMLDLAIDVMGPSRRARVSVELAVRSGRVFRVSRVALQDADRFVEALRKL